jgi:hypothetical protein
VEGMGHKLYVDNYSSAPALFNDLYMRKINCCGTECHNRKNMPPNFRPKVLKMKEDDMLRQYKETCKQSAEGNFRDESGNPVKPLVSEDYNARMCYVDKSYQMATSYGMCRSTWN